MRAKSKKAKVKSKRGRKAKVDKAPEIAVRAARSGNKVNAQSKALFLDHHLPKIARLKEVMATANANLRNGLKAAKADGFLKRDFDIAFRLKTQMGEREIKATIARDLTIAKWLGFSVGKQLDLFVQEDQQEIEVNAYAAGEDASKNNKPAEPPLPAGEPAFEAYMRGFHDHQELLLQSGLNQGIAPVSGVPMTRSQFKAQQAAKAAARKADKYIEPEQMPMFSKRSPDEAAE